MGRCRSTPSHNWPALTRELLAAGRCRGQTETEVARQLGLSPGALNALKNGHTIEPSWGIGEKILKGKRRYEP
jgi:hypothetical protein